MMTKRALLAEQLPDSAAHGAVEPEAIRPQLGRLVESPSFRASKRCRLFLEHAIEHALSANAAPLKEREVGMQVFGREPSYDTAADPIVRVTAGEIRRRLGQYYAEPAHQRELRIDLPAGSYTPTFTWPADAPPAPALQPVIPAAPAATAASVLTPASFARSTSVPGIPGISERHAAPLHDARASARAWSSRRGIAAFGAIAAAVLLGTFAVMRQPATTFDRFWGPLIQSRVPVLLCTGSIDVYELPGELKRAADRAAYASAAAASAAAAIATAPATATTAGASAAIATTPVTAAAASASAVIATTPATAAAAPRAPAGPPALFLVDPREVMRVGAGFVSVADAVALVRFASLFQERGTPYHVRENRSTSFADLRTSPTVLVGMFSNAWTLQLGADFRFVPERSDSGERIVIRDRQHPERADWQVTAPWPKLAIARDYALVSRVFDRATGTMVVSSAGITPYGTTAAAEFLTSPQHLEAALRHAPPDWPNKNLQIVLETRVIDGAAAPPHVLATHVW
jgi:hypothetical protein